MDEGLGLIARPSAFAEVRKDPASNGFVVSLFNRKVGEIVLHCKTVRPHPSLGIDHQLQSVAG
jgi:hypothetical protein